MKLCSSVYAPSNNVLLKRSPAQLPKVQFHFCATLCTSTTERCFLTVNLSTSMFASEFISTLVCFKAIKTAEELAGMKEAHVKDAMAKVTFLAWLENLAEDSTALRQETEWTVAQHLDDLRKMMVNPPIVLRPYVLSYTGVCPICFMYSPVA